MRTDVKLKTYNLTLVVIINDQTWYIYFINNHIPTLNIYKYR